MENTEKIVFKADELKKVMDYTKRAHLNNFYDVLNKNKKYLIAGKVKKSELLNYNSFKHNSDVLNAMGVLALKGTLAYSTETQQEMFNLLDKSKMILDGEEMVDNLFYNEWDLEDHLYFKNNYEYFNEVLAQIAKNNGWEYYDRESFIKRSFTAEDFTNSFVVVYHIPNTKYRLRLYDYDDYTTNESLSRIISSIIDHNGKEVVGIYERRRKKE